jgi:methionyl-tRNA formyltransferase
VAAERLGIPVHQPERPALPEPVDRVVVCAYGLYIPPRLLEQSLWLNVHPSLLPRWRGAAPVERAILAGDAETGVTIHRTVAELDAGPIAAKEGFAIGELDAGGVYSLAGELAGRQLAAVLPDPQFTPQEEDGATYAEKIAPADRELDLDDPVDAWRRVRALSPHIGAWTTFHDRRVTVWQARLEDGVFVPEVVQPEGRRRMSYDEFLRGVR